MGQDQDREPAPPRARANRRLALILGAVALAFYAAFFWVMKYGRVHLS